MRAWWQVVAGRSVTIVPIMVGSISPTQEALYGRCVTRLGHARVRKVDWHSLLLVVLACRLLAPYLEDPANFFVIR